MNSLEQDNFKILKISNFINLSSDYDYESIMHYPDNAHAINESLKTIVLITNKTINPGERLSKIDVDEIRQLYKCKPRTYDLIL